MDGDPCNSRSLCSRWFLVAILRARRLTAIDESPNPIVLHPINVRSPGERHVGTVEGLCHLARVAARGGIRLNVRDGAAELVSPRSSCRRRCRSATAISRRKRPCFLGMVPSLRARMGHECWPDAPSSSCAPGGFVNFLGLAPCSSRSSRFISWATVARTPLNPKLKRS